MEAKQNLKKVFEELSFTLLESEAFLKSIQIMKDSQLDNSINPMDKFIELVNGVVHSEI